jgi:hypothetical protein
MTSQQGIYSQMPEDDAHLLRDVLNNRNPALAQQLGSTTTIPEETRKAVRDILAKEFTKELLPSYEPNERGREIDALLRRFLEKWPIPA